MKKRLTLQELKWVKDIQEKSFLCGHIAILEKNRTEKIQAHIYSGGGYYLSSEKFVAVSKKEK
jgi:hypothetical protein